MAAARKSPSTADIAAAILAASAAIPAAPVQKDDSLSKTVITGICALLGAIVLALIFWVGSSVSTLSTDVTKMSANVDNLQKSITDLQQGQGASAKTIADLQAGQAASGARSTAIEQDIGRIKERVRTLEGQPPLRP